MNRLEKILQLIAQYKNDLTDEYKPHYCDSAFCNPQTIRQLRLSGQYPGVEDNDEIYLCNYRQYHICNANECHCSTCPISGACYGASLFSSYSPQDQRTWNVGPEDDDTPVLRPMPGWEHTIQAEPSVEPAQKRFRANTSEVRNRVETLIERFLYGQERVKINHEFDEQKDKNSRRKKEAYVNQCVKHNRPVNLLEICMMNDHEDSLGAPLEILEKDMQVVHYLTFIVLQVYEIVQRYGGINGTQGQGKVDVVSVTVATLYYMRKGYVLDDVTILPVNDLLREHLPIMNYLPKFGVEKRKLLKGEKVVKYSYSEALKQGVDIHELCLRHYEEGPQFQAL